MRIDEDGRKVVNSEDMDPKETRTILNEHVSKTGNKVKVDVAKVGDSYAFFVADAKTREQVIRSDVIFEDKDDIEMFFLGVLDGVLEAVEG